MMRVLVAAVVVFLGLRFGAGDRALSAIEIDALAGGASLSAELAEDGSLSERLVAGFEAVPRHPEGKALDGQKAWRLRVADPPLPRWLAAAGAGELESTRWIAALLVALTAGIVGLMSPVWWVGMLVFLALAGVWDAAAGAGGAAAAAASMALLMGAVERLGIGRGGGLAVGVALGLTFMVHPGGLFLLVPVFVGVAIAGRARRTVKMEDGSAPLPEVPLTLFAAPIVAVVVLVVGWPSLWAETGKHLAAWFTDTWWLVAGAQDVAGVRFTQDGGRAPMAWSGLWAWAIWTGPLLMVAWLAGLRATIVAGWTGAWTPILMVVTVVLTAGIDGGLFGGRLDLLAWLWAPTAVTAAIGVETLRGALAARTNRWVGWVVAIVLVVPSLGAGALAMDPPGAAQAGATQRMPLPLGELAMMAEESGGGSVFIMSGQMGYRYALETAAAQAELDMGWAGRKRADWLVLVDTGSPKVDEELAKREGEEPFFAATVAGVEMWGFRR